MVARWDSIEFFQYFARKSNGETREESTWQAHQFILDIIGAECTSSLNIGNDKSIINEGKMAIFDRFLNVFKPGLYVARMWDD